MDYKVFSRCYAGHYRPKNMVRWLLTLLVITAASHSAMQAQQLYSRIEAPQLDENQQRYLQNLLDNPSVVDIQFIEVDLSVLQKESFMVPVYNESLWADKRHKGVQSGSIRSWVGDMLAVDYGQVNIAYDHEMMVANIAVEDKIFAIHPLGGGIHVLATLEVDKEEACGVTDGKEQLDVQQQPDIRTKLTHPDILNNQEFSGGAKATGECKVRVLVAYTSGARNALANIMLSIINEFNMANTGYDNSGVNMEIEPAIIYQTNYTEGGDDLDDHLCRFQSTATTNIPILSPCGGYMLEVHDLRTLWRADQCALITTGGGGLAYVDLSYDRQFSVTGLNNFNGFTFQHELAHNALCTHAVNQDEQPGTAPYAGYGHSSGCFRTVLAYQDACGTGSGTCPRQNIFSDNVAADWSCGGIIRARGTNNARNTDRLNLSRATLRGFETVLTNPTFSQDYNWLSREYVSFVGSSSVTYTSTSNEFILQSGSAGEFRASNSITLGTGFWARSGTEFSAYLESCTAGDPPADQALEYIEDEVEPELFTNGFNATVFPNPFRGTSTLLIDLDAEANVEIALFDMLGKQVAAVQNAVSMPAGSHQFQFDGAKMTSGIYFIQIKVDDRVTSLKLVRQ